MRAIAAISFLGACLWLAACSAQPTATPTFHAEGRPALLSDWGQISVAQGELVAADTVQHYELRVPLFTDYAQKYRTVWMPEGTSATYNPTEVFDFPIGTVITKTFYYTVPDGAEKLSGDVLKQQPVKLPLGDSVDLTHVRLLETRILAHRADGWVALPYVWNEAQTDATLKRTGDLMNLTLVDGDKTTDFAYVVPNANQCAGCHATNNTTREIKPIGPKARHLWGVELQDNDTVTPQLIHWENEGLLGGMKENIKSSSVESGPVNSIEELLDRVRKNNDAHSDGHTARAYLDINCSHCHSEVGPADTSGLHLTPDTPVGPHLGLCKTPIAAGRGTGNRQYGIVPGDADASILHYRIVSNKADIMMPELGRSLVHEEGAVLIRDWINAMEGDCAG